MVSSTADRDTRRKSRVALGHERELHQSHRYRIKWENGSPLSAVWLKQNWGERPGRAGVCDMVGGGGDEGGGEGVIVVGFHNIMSMSSFEQERRGESREWIGHKALMSRYVRDLARVCLTRLPNLLYLNNFDLT